MCLNAFFCYKYNMYKRKNQSTSSLSKRAKKVKTSVKPNELTKKDFKVKVRLPTSLTTGKGKSDKSPKTPSTSNAVKGKNQTYLLHQYSSKKTYLIAYLRLKKG